MPEEEAGATPQSVVEMYESGMSWEEITEELGIGLDEAMQRYRDEAYDHWDTGWTRDAADGTSHVTTGDIDFWTDGEATLRIEELNEFVPLVVEVENGETETLAQARFTAEQARDIAATLDECADIMEAKQ